MGKKSILNWFGAIMSNFEAHFLCFHEQKINLNSFLKYCRVRTEKLHRIKVKKKVKKNWEFFFLRGNPPFFRATNINVKVLKEGFFFSHQNGTFFKVLLS